jgi:predicted nucleic acid-binding Zn ribbon protein
MEEKRLHPPPEIRKSPSCPDHQGSVSGARLCAGRRDHPVLEERISSAGREGEVRSMERKRIAILVILVLLVLGIILMALWLAGQLA